MVSDSHQIVQMDPYSLTIKQAHMRKLLNGNIAGLRPPGEKGRKKEVSKIMGSIENAATAGVTRHAG